eukprot:390300-Pyramimonas_sp.AAC.1
MAMQPMTTRFPMRGPMHLSEDGAAWSSPAAPFRRELSARAGTILIIRLMRAISTVIKNVCVAALVTTIVINGALL